MRPLLIVAILMIIGTLIIGYAVSMASDLIAEPLFRSWPAWVWMKYRFIIGIAVIIWPRVQVVRTKEFEVWLLRALMQAVGFIIDGLIMSGHTTRHHAAATGAGP